MLGKGRVLGFICIVEKCGMIWVDWFSLENGLQHSFWFVVKMFVVRI